MASLVETFETASRQLRLQGQSGKTIAYGVRESYLVELALGPGNDSLVEFIRHGDPRRDATLRKVIERSDIGKSGVNVKRVKVQDGTVVYRHARGVFRNPSGEAVAGEVEALLRTVKQACPPMPSKCRLCGSDSGSEPVLVNGLVDRVCGGCIERLQYEARRALEKYDELPLRLPLAVLAATGLAVVGAIGWAGVAVATGRMFWAIAIGMGLLLGYGTKKAAGKGGRIVQVLAGALTVISVLLGQALFLAYHVHRYAQGHGQRVDWGMFVSDLPNLFGAMAGSTVFALAGGLLGAYYAARTARKPPLEVRVEKHGEVTLPRS